jgi:hypothetical protein
MTFHAIRQRPRRMLAVAQDGEQSAGGLRSDAYGEPAYIGKRVILLTVADALLSTTWRAAATHGLGLRCAWNSSTSPP